MSDYADRAAEALARLRQDRPLIHHITNVVVMNDVANLTLHLGALPVMAHAAEEVAEVTGSAHALILNLGTLTPERVVSMRIASQTAYEAGIPSVLDPVGVGASGWRKRVALQLLDERFVSIVRGNAGEIGALSGAGGQVRGVESVEGLRDPMAAVRKMASERVQVVALTGERDIISDGESVLAVENGHRWLTAITGAGCMATTAIAAFAAVEPDCLLAAAGGLACLGLAAERAASAAQGPASFKVALLDEVYKLTPEHMATGARIVDWEKAEGK